MSLASDIREHRDKEALASESDGRYREGQDKELEKGYYGQRQVAGDDQQACTNQLDTSKPQKDPTTISLSLWTSSFIAVERLLIECFNYSLYRTRKYSFIFSMILFNLIFLTHITEFKRRKLKPDPISPNIYRCTYDHFEWSDETWDIIDRIGRREHLHIGVPCFLHLISTISILIHIVKHKIYINEAENQFCQVLLIQVKKHKDFFIPPILIILCSLPRLLFELITPRDCLESNMKFKLRMCIVFRYIYYLPQTIPFFIYVYPSSVYMNQFHRTKIAIYLFEKNKTVLSQKDIIRKEKKMVNLKLFRFATEIMWTISLYRGINSCDLALRERLKG
ncbi:unnamed protein product [Didymodactylos carnosus]|uniref:Uncharacterized protein n=1 Tax=Didymodactylos carnosus TaxID=1234261 RepID=A0A814K837_9BILA|nr:unnamed protein product [Didymodactylos carnosus]CAF3817974.1 unnamed protein product [Didymodactylos carnosus]